VLVRRFGAPWRTRLRTGPRRWRHRGKSASVPIPVVAPEDEALLQRALRGDRAARRQLADRLIEPIQREVAIAITRAAAGSGRDARQEVRDLVQDVLVLLFEHDARELRRWDPARGRSLESFVRLIARRRVARVLGQRRGNPWALVLVDAELDDDGEGQGEPELVARLEQRNLLDAVLLALQARMDDRDHELFELVFVEERDPGEVAELVGISRGAVSAWGYRMRKLARALASQIGGDNPSSPMGASSTGEVERG
jgi:RNA polymerase sigma factor (sigma-70 family)